MKEDSGRILAKIADVMQEDDRGQFILTKVLGMAHDDLVENNRIVAIQVERGRAGKWAQQARSLISECLNSY